MEHRYFQTTDGVRLHYAVAGEGEPIVILPGLGQCAENYNCILDAYTNDYKVYILDYRNHGESDTTEYGNHIEMYAKDTLEMLQDAKIDTFDLMAHSMGNAVAWCFMELYGNERIQRYVLVEEAPILLSDPMWSEKESLTYRGLMDWPSFAPEGMRGPTRAEMVCRIYHDHVNRDWRDAFRYLTMPVQIIMGTKSHYASQELWDYLQEVIPDNEFVLLEGGHAIFADSPEEFVKCTLEFLKKKESLKESYKVDEKYAADNKSVLIVSAGGNWGGHFAIGMPGACHCDAVISIHEDYPENENEIKKDFLGSGLPVKVEFREHKEITDRIQFYQDMEKEYGHFSGIIDAEGIDTIRSFPGSDSAVQGPVGSAKDMKQRYQMSGEDALEGKRVLIFGAGGNWGGHMAVGMALAGKADLILVDTLDRAEAVEKIADEVGKAVRVKIIYVPEEDLHKRYPLLEELSENESWDSFMDMTELNTF